MVMQTIFKGLVLAMLIGLTHAVFATSDSAKIGIRVEIKAKQGCDYSYSLDSASNLKYSKHSHFSSCHNSMVKLQQQAEEIVKTEFKTSQSGIEGQQLRIFMVVQ